MTDSYFTIKESVFSELKISKSLFITGAYPFRNQLEIPDLLNNVRKRYHDASHHPYAFRAGLSKNSFRTSDDGEPSGTSGKPILEAIDKYRLTDILVVVTRYFGGIKLGTGGLRRAYFTAADECLIKSKVTEKFLTEFFVLSFEYKYMNQVMRMIEDLEAKIIENNSGESCLLKIESRLSKSEKIKDEFIRFTNGTGKII